MSTRPPTFVLFVSQAGALPDSYLRYLTNSIRTTFDLPGVPLRLRLRAGREPVRMKRMNARLMPDLVRSLRLRSWQRA